MTSVAAVHEHSNSTKLKGSLGTLGISLMVIATAAPLTVMAGVSPLIIGLGNGLAAPTDALVVTIVMLLFSVGFVSMSKHVDNAGAFYSYIQKGLGRILGLGAASLAVFSYSVIVIALEAYIGFVVSDALASFLGLTVPWWASTFAIVAIVGFLGYRNIDVSTKVLGCALLLEISIILLVDFVIIATGGHSGLNSAPLEPSAFFTGSPGLGILFAVFGFIGFESTVVYREEAANPERTIPLATYVAVLFIGSLYFLSFWSAVVGIGAEDVVRIAKENAGTMYVNLVGAYLGKSIGDVTQLLLITSLFAVVLSIHNVIARYKYVLGRHGVLSSHLAKVHDTHASPHIASISQTVVSFGALSAAVLLGMDPVMQVYTWGAAAGTLGYMIIVALACFAIIVFFYNRPEGSDVWRTKIAPGLALIGLGAFLYIAFNNLSALTGVEGLHAVNFSIVALLVGAFLVGAVGAILMMVAAPRRYEAILERA